MVVQRITMFKVPKEESYQTIFAEYAKLSSATKVGPPFHQVMVVSKYLRVNSKDQA